MRKYKPLKNRKPYHQPSTLDALSEHQEALIQHWFLNEDVTFKEVRRRIHEQFSVKVSQTTIRTFWHRHCAPIIAARTGQEGDILKEYHPPSTLSGISDAQRQKLKNWLVSENITYKAAIVRLKDRFGLKVSYATVCAWYQKHCKLEGGK